MQSTWMNNECTLTSKMVEVGWLHWNVKTYAQLQQSHPCIPLLLLKALMLAIQALLRYGAHEDGMHHHTKSPDSFHPAYAAFNPTDNKVICRMDLVEVSLGNIFDAITLQDCLDGRLSILIRCPGSDSTISAEKLTVDVYVTPHEVLGYKCVCGDPAMLIQAFCQEFAIPHLQCFTEQCKIESIRAPKPHSPLTSVQWVQSPSFSAGQITFLLLIKKAQSSSTLITSLHQHSTCHHRPADAFLHPATTTSLEPILLVTPPEQLALGLPLIGIGPNTDAILNHFSLEDDLLPCLHILVGTVHSSCWEVVLRAMPWNLTYTAGKGLMI
ncbi:hypothetical protein EDC04DRAFT_2605810 [Pisolithus marmoratus]|nr:hypothetical protein EDC04DRAFT_2605810 [Pisolithus marmoratus]